MQDTIEALKKFPLLKGLDDSNLEIMSKCIGHRTLEDGEIIFQEDDMSNEIYLIKSGAIEIFRGKNTIAVLRDGEQFGELAFLDSSPRSASARSAGQTNLLIIYRRNIEKLQERDKLLNILTANIALSTSERLKNTNDKYIESLKKQLETLKIQHEFGQFFIFILISYAISMIINYLLNTSLHNVNLYSATFAWSYLIILLVPSLFTVWIFKMPLSQLGVTLKNWKKSLIEGLIVSVMVVVIFLNIYIYLKHKGSTTINLLAFTPIVLSRYLAHSYIQELISRGFVQTAFQRFFDDQKGIKSVFLASALFGILHIHFGLTAILITFISGIFFGMFYLRHNNLIGVTLIHWVAGICAFSLSMI